MTANRTSQQFRQTTSPFPYRREGLVFDLDSVSLDGNKPREIDVTRANRRWGFPVDDWDRCLLFGTLELPEDVVDTVLPADERDDPPAQLYVAVRCRETIYRDRAIVTEAPATAGTYDVKLRLQREDFRGEIELQPYLTRTTDRPGDDSGYATLPHVRLASAKPWAVIVDGSQDSEEDVGLEARVEPFGEDPRLPDDGLYYLDFGDPSQPRLLLNGTHRRVVDVLQSEGSVGAEARLRDVVFDQIQYSVWTQLILRAGAAVDQTGRPKYDWQRTVLRIFARDLYGIDDTKAAARRLRRDLDDPTRLPDVMQRIDVELQRYLEHRDQLLHLMEEGLQI